MASVDWMKIHVGGQAAKMRVHFQQEKRIECDHSNTDINKKLTPMNYSLGADDYDSAVRALNKRVAEVDAVLPPKRVKKDRTIGFMLYTPCPLEIEKMGKADEFFEKVHEAYKKEFGEENVMGTFVHKDEKHIYIDASTKQERESLMHGHTLLSAFVPGKGINGKQCSSRKEINRVNQIMIDICHEYGVEWHTGLGKNKATIEEQKALSAELRADQAEQEAAMVRYETDMLIAQKSALTDNIDQVKSSLEHLELKEEKAKDNMDVLMRTINNLGDQYEEKKEALAEIGILPDTVSQLQKQMADQVALIDKLKEETRTAQDKAQTLEKEMAEQSVTISSLQKRLSDVASALGKASISNEKSMLRAYKAACELVADIKTYIDQRKAHEQVKEWKPENIVQRKEQKQR